MLTRKDITENIKPGSYIQVLADAMPGIPGELRAITDTAIILGPYNFSSSKKLDEVREIYGESVSGLSVIPLETINLIFKLNITPDET